jgi:hypothetical protein
LTAAETRERKIAQHGELERTNGTEKNRSEARGKRKRCSIPACSKYVDGSARFVEHVHVLRESAFLIIKFKSEDMKENEQEFSNEGGNMGSWLRLRARR